jgi:hypothetical protein
LSADYKEWMENFYHRNAKLAEEGMIGLPQKYLEMVKTRFVPVTLSSRLPRVVCVESAIEFSYCKNQELKCAIRLQTFFLQRGTVFRVFWILKMICFCFAKCGQVLSFYVEVMLAIVAVKKMDKKENFDYQFSP